MLILSKNTHKGVGANRRPINRSNIKKRLDNTSEVLKFLKKRNDMDN